MLRAVTLAALLALGAPSAGIAQSTLPPAQSVGPELLPGPSPLAVGASPRPQARTMVVPKARWDAHGGKRSWTMSVVKGLRSHASVLTEIVPRDIANWCPAYPSASRSQREAFWVGLISALAKHESTYRPTAVGGGGRWYGLVQIYPPTARLYGCKARSGAALKDPEDNLSCALRIMAKTVARDRVVSKGMRGVAADWGPFHSRKKRRDMINWVRQQNYCIGLARSLKPVARPAGLGEPAPHPVLEALPEDATVGALSEMKELVPREAEAAADAPPRAAPDKMQLGPEETIVEAEDDGAPVIAPVTGAEDVLPSGSVDDALAGSAEG